MLELEDLKAHLRVTHDADDGLIAQYEESAIATVERWTGQYFGTPGEHTVYVKGYGTNTLYLPYAPHGDDEIEVVERSDVSDLTGTYIHDALDSGFVVRGSTLVRKGGVWTLDNEYAVTFTRAGYEAGAEPADIREKVMALVALWYNNREASEERAKAEEAIRLQLPSNPVLA